MTAPLADRRGWPLTLALLLAVSGLIGASLVQAEVVSMTAPGPSEAGRAIHEKPVTLECWQNGRRIVQRGGLSGLSVSAVGSRKDAVAFKQVDSEQPEVFLLPFDDSLCLVSPEG